jgi:hypothetical protein
MNIPDTNLHHNSSFMLELMLQSNLNLIKEQMSIGLRMKQMGIPVD